MAGGAAVQYPRGWIIAILFQFVVVECTIHIVITMLGCSCGVVATVFRCQADNRMPSSIFSHQSYFPSCIFAVVRDSACVVMAYEWEGMYDGRYGSSVIKGDAVFCMRR